MRIPPILCPLLVVLCAVLAACNPTYNWRDHTSSDGTFRVQFPSKPATHTRSIDLGGIRVDMTMTAADVNGTTFAVGTALAPDPALALATLPAMRQALLRNIGAVENAAGSATVKPGLAALEVDATGKGNGAPVRLVGRFAAKGARVYQVIVMGRPDAMPAEQTEQFLTSFAPQ